MNDEELCATQLAKNHHVTIWRPCGVLRRQTGMNQKEPREWSNLTQHCRVKTASLKDCDGEPNTSRHNLRAILLLLREDSAQNARNLAMAWISGSMMLCAGILREVAVDVRPWFFAQLNFREPVCAPRVAPGCELASK